MRVKKFLDILNVDFYVGVPDSQLKELCNFLYKQYGVDKKHHIIAANEGNCVGIAAGYNLATGRVPLVYMQNSGEGNAINPITSLVNHQVYGIPMIFVIGWRGEPGVHDEPQHIFQGKITTQLLEVLDIPYFVIDKDTREEDVQTQMASFEKELQLGNQVAFVVRKNAFESEEICNYENANTITREDAIEHIVKIAGDSPIISTTGKASRELFEIRERNKQSHDKDFLTVGSMGHSSSIALGIALNKPMTKVWCLDGDGAAIMHMGAMATIGSCATKNLVHVVINNQAHESVGGMPTAGGEISLTKIAEACGYKNIFSVSKSQELESALKTLADTEGLSFLEIKCAVGSRKDLGRPADPPKYNKDRFIQFLTTLD